MEKTGRVTYVVTVGGKKFEPGGTSTCYSISTIYKANKVPHAIITFLDGNPAKKEFALSSSTDLEPGAEVSIAMGYKEETEKVFKGIIVKHSVKLTGNNSYTIIECRDPVIKMTIAKKSRVFGDGSAAAGDDDHLKKIFTENGLSSRLTVTGSDFIKQTTISQYYATDWDFVLNRAEINGKLVLVKKPGDEDGKICIVNPAVGSPKLTLTFGQDLFDFESEANAITQIAEVESSTWDGDTQAVIKSAKASSSTFKQLEATGIMASDLNTIVGPTTLSLFHTGEVEKAELEGWSKAVMEKSAHSKVKGSFKVLGDPTITIGDTIELKGIGTKFSGKVVVTGVTQEYSQTSWFTRIYFGLDQNWHSENFNIHQQPAAGLTSGISGLQIGKVLKRDGDPAGKFRIQIKLPMIDATAKFWARMLFDYANATGGTFFWPEVDDEVLVGFLNDDPRNPVILGALFNKKTAPVVPPAAENDIKAIVTKSDLRLEFNDKDKIVTIKTPGGNIITIDDKEKQIQLKDQHGNEVTMNKTEISLSSKGAISLKATKDVTISGANIKLDAKQGMDVGGLDVTVAAKGKFAASGNTGVEIKTSAIAILKGTMVKIN
jgi:Rhs element Vgr protein